MIEREPVRQPVREHLYRWILENRTSPGDPVRLSAAAKALGVSVTPVREALISLESDGIVSSEMGRGFTVRPFSTDELEELYPLIWGLEEQALRASGPLSPAEIARLRFINAAMAEATTPIRIVTLDDEWHSTLLAQSPHRIAREILSGLKRRVFRYECRFMSEVDAPSSVEQHEAVIVLCERGELDDAASALVENWKTGPAVLVPCLRNQKTLDG